ncbi:hypothetical protein EBR66_00515 [bacterium]|nr:hypothetical protein [bacterium]
MLGIVADFTTKLRTGAITPEEAKRFLRREDPFAPQTAGTFNPATFIGKNWDIIGEHKSLPEGWNPSLLKTVCPLKKCESYLNGNEWKKRLEGTSLLGVEAFWLCWNNQEQIPAELKDKIIFFDGDELRGPDDDRYSLCLNWHGGRWDWSFDWLGDSRNASYVSACAG